MPIETDFLIVGAGLAGLVMAERLATQQHARCLVVEKRLHIGGNCFDYYDDYGVLVHGYGPHYFRTNAPRIREYLSQFTQWHPVEYTIKSFSDGRYGSFPINLNTLEEVIVSQVGCKLYEKFFLGYTLKQWKRHPRELDPSVCGRIPVRTNRDNRYLREDFQALPAAGYTAMFQRMLSACGNLVQVLLNTDFREVLSHLCCRHLIFTGPIDEFYDRRFGALPYRSLRFEQQ